jgi:3-hydroxyacyl-CoA dehydrogenase/enoyl-CoA hydratase/3-hydroxybutyryl-CoA epimerase/3-hydroxyacyl-CoA dehydrogenase/enoyl-CoA hydratase/3-hydroxybutyryl-CoA epimerase/enoyl-CoA isomerase
MHAPDSTAAAANVAALIQRNEADRGIDRVDVQVRPVRHVGVIGAGVMGCAIAASNVYRGLAVTISDADAQALARSASAVVTLASELDADSDSAPSSYPDLLHVAQADEQFAACDLVLETIVETLEVKRKVLRRLEPHLPATTVLASNTSTIPIGQLASVLAVPERFCGIHFCNPVRHRRLVEIVRGAATSDETVATAVAYAKQLGKLPIVVGDSPGFLVNRILFPYLSAALELLSEGATPRQVEEAALSFGMILGPLGLYDLIGIDTAFYAGRSMWDTFRDRIVPSPILPALFKAGRLGVKKGMGFYAYDAQGCALEIDAGVARLVEPYVRERRTFDEQQLVARLFLPMLLEATRALQEGLVRDPRDVDVAAIFGLGFPAARGGLLHWADELGAATILEMLAPLARLGPRAAPTPMLEELARHGRRFYG